MRGVLFVLVFFFIVFFTHAAIRLHQNCFNIMWTISGMDIVNNPSNKRLLKHALICEVHWRVGKQKITKKASAKAYPKMTLIMKSSS